MGENDKQDQLDEALLKLKTTLRLVYDIILNIDGYDRVTNLKDVLDRLRQIKSMKPAVDLSDLQMEIILSKNHPLLLDKEIRAAFTKDALKKGITLKKLARNLGIGKFADKLKKEQENA